MKYVNSSSCLNTEPVLKTPLDMSKRNHFTLKNEVISFGYKSAFLLPIIVIVLTGFLYDI